MDRRAFLATAVSASIAGIAGCADVLGQDEFDVGMTANAFEPDELTVGVGETVVWRNTSSRGHTVTAYEEAIPEDAAYFASGGFDSEAAAREAWNGRDEENGIFATGDEFRHTVTVPGRYEYVCLPHEGAGMVGTIVVEE